MSSARLRLAAAEDSMMSGRLLLAHRARWVRQRLAPPQLGIIGGYHGANLGDMALGAAVRACSPPTVSTALQTIYRLDVWPNTEAAIVGGGAVAYELGLGQLELRYGTRPDRLAILGVDFNEEEAIDRHSSFLSQVYRISCRSRRRATELGDALGRDDIEHHPDLAFALLQGRTPPPPRRPVLGINIVPYLVRAVGNRFSPGNGFSEEQMRELPGDLAEAAEPLSRQYVSYMRRWASDAVRAGWQVNHIPFTPQDAKYARVVFSGLPIRHYAYSPNPQVGLQRVAASTHMVASRYHALIFGWLTGRPTTSFQYASKCTRLLEDFGLSVETHDDAGALAAPRAGAFEERLAKAQQPPTDLVRDASRVARAIVASAIDGVTRHRRAD